MGLDMYLTKKIYVGAEYEHRNVKAVVDITVGDKKLNIDVTKISQIEERVGYWRKANQIHNWFVANVQDGVDDCGDYYVSREKMRELLGVCKKVIGNSNLVKGVISNGETLKDGEWIPNFESGNIIENPEVANELLPTGSGFFFGSTDYDEWYLKKIEYTAEVLENCLKDSDGEYYYSASW